MSLSYADCFALYDNFCRKYYDFSLGEWVHSANRNCVRDTKEQLWEDFNGYPDDDILVVSMSKRTIQLLEARRHVQERARERIEGRTTYVGED